MRFLLLSVLALALVVPTQAQAEEKKGNDSRTTVHHHHRGHNGHQWGGWGGWGGGWGHRGWGGHYHHASTAAEGYLNGLGQLYRGQGYYLVSLGRYQIMHERARRLYIDNWQHAVRTWWSVRDEYKERYRRDNPDFVTREHKRLDMAEKLHELKLRKQLLLEEGVLKTPPESAFFYNGEKFANYAEFKKSPKYAELITDARMRTTRYKLEQRAAEQRLTEAHKFMSKWNNMGYSERESYKRRREIQKRFPDLHLGSPNPN